MLAYMRFLGEMPSRVALLPEGSCIIAMPELLCHHLPETSTAFPVGSEKWLLESGSTTPAPYSIPEGSQQWEVA